MTWWYIIIIWLFYSFFTWFVHWWSTGTYNTGYFLPGIGARRIHLSYGRISYLKSFDCIIVLTLIRCKINVIIIIMSYLTGTILLCLKCLVDVLKLITVKAWSGPVIRKDETCRGTRARQPTFFDERDLYLNAFYPGLYRSFLYIAIKWWTNYSRNKFPFSPAWMRVQFLHFPTFE